MNVDDRPGRADWIVGSAKAMRGDRSDFFNFSCSVDLRDGDVRIGVRNAALDLSTAARK
jgi:hypothetical protein